MTARSRFDLPEPQYSTVVPHQTRLQQQQQPVQSHLQQLHIPQPSQHYTLTQTHDENYVQLRNNPALYPVVHPPLPTGQNKLMNGGSSSSPYSNMTRHTLHALSATPKPKLTNDWVQHRRSEHSQDLYQDVYRQKDPYLRQVNRMSDAWIQNQQKRKSDPLGGAGLVGANNTYDYSNHWLIQEAEQRRLEQQRGSKSATTTKKPLPDSVIQTITQRVQSLGIGERRR